MFIFCCIYLFCQIITMKFETYASLTIATHLALVASKAYPTKDQLKTRTAKNGKRTSETNKKKTSKTLMERKSWVKPGKNIKSRNARIRRRPNIFAPKKLVFALSICAFWEQNGKDRSRLSHKALWFCFSLFFMLLLLLCVGNFNPFLCLIWLRRLVRSRGSWYSNIWSSRRHACFDTSVRARVCVCVCMCVFGNVS